MLPKDLLKYARKFSPEEIERAIMWAIRSISQTIPQRALTYAEWLDIESMRQQAAYQAMPPLPRPNPWQTVDPWGVTTTTTSGGYTGGSTFTTTSIFS